MEEFWKAIKGYEGLYQVSNVGRVRSLDRRVCNHRSGSTRFAKGQILAANDNGHGYKYVTLRTKNSRKNVYVHRLVAEHFLEQVLSKDYVNHLDCDTSNNAVTNLEWCTQKENVRYASEHLKKAKTKCRSTNTGEKYISRRIYNSKYVRYRVNIRGKGIDKSFATLEDAVSFRNEVIQ